MPADSRAHQRHQLGEGRRLPLAALALAAAACVCIAAWPKLDYWRQSVLAAALAEQAEKAPPGAARLIIRDLESIDLPAIDALIQLSGGPESETRRAAAESVMNKLYAWGAEFRSTGDQRRLTDRLTVAADALHRRVPGYQPAAKAWARQAGEKIVELSANAASPKVIHILAACEGVLDLAADLPLPSPGSAVLGLATVNERPAAIPINQPPANHEQSGPLVKLPEALPISSAADPTPTTSGSEADLHGLGPGFPVDGPLADSAPDVSLNHDWEMMNSFNLMSSPWEQGLSIPLSVAPDDPIDAGISEPQLPPPADEVVDVPGPQEIRAAENRFRRMDGARLQAELAAAPPYEALTIRRIMNERSGPLTPAGNRRVPSLHSDVSRNLARIARLSIDEARRELRVLVEDPNPEVRLEALTMLATTADPLLREIAARRAREDTDRRVSDLASRLLRTETR